MTSDATTRQSPQTQVLTEEDYDKDYWLKILEKRHSVKYMPIIVMTIKGTGIGLLLIAIHCLIEFGRYVRLLKNVVLLQNLG